MNRDKFFGYTGRNLLQIAMPVGGIGAGSVCLNGYGGLQDFSLRHKPFFTALPDGHVGTDAAFAVLHLPDDKITKLVEGPLAPEKVYDQGLQAQGYRKAGYEGFPRFRSCRFEGRYPFGTVKLRDPKIPLAVSVTAFNPFIPLDDKNSGIPCAILEYELQNTSRKPVHFELSYHLSHLAPGSLAEERSSRNEVIPDRGIYFYNSDSPQSASFGSACLMSLNKRVLVKGMWFRGGWFDAMSSIWREVSAGAFSSNAGSSVDIVGRNGGSILLRGRLNPGQSISHSIVITWYFPNSYQTAGSVDIHGREVCCSSKEKHPLWQPYYAGVWKNAKDVANYVRSNYSSLRKRTHAFVTALFSSTLPREVLDAISANLAILKSPTVLRQKNGNVWGWEGCFTTSGCCAGSCTHVWNYAQSMPHLFPSLERGLREQELLRSMDKDGRVAFRATLPDGLADFTFHPAADGQLGGILKLHRDWQISGDSQWMSRLYPKVKCSLEYCINTWDPHRRGALFEPHHNTYDIEFWGANGMCTSIYLGALSAMSEMARFLGKKKDASDYSELAIRGARFMDNELFNGAYYEQKVEYKNLRDRSFLKLLNDSGQDGELAALLKKEGPKYQYGSGCLSDGIIGGWMADLYGISLPLNREKVRSTLKSIFRYNFREKLSEHACGQRPGYALPHEGGLLLCSWPRGGRPTLPFVYSDEIWTGIEYQVASHLIMEGFVKEGVKIVKAARKRYDGYVRNPWNEYECGSYYARAMSSYALLNSFSGFRYSAVSKELWFGPKIAQRPFTTFYSTASGYGSICLGRKDLQISIIEGSLEIAALRLQKDQDEKILTVGKTARPGRPVCVSL